MSSGSLLPSFAVVSLWLCPTELTRLAYMALPVMVMNAAPLSVYTTCPPLGLRWSCSTLPVMRSPVPNDVPVRPWV